MDHRDFLEKVAFEKWSKRWVEINRDMFEWAEAFPARQNSVKSLEGAKESLWKGNKMTGKEK